MASIVCHRSHYYCLLHVHFLKNSSSQAVTIGLSHIHKSITSYTKQLEDCYRTLNVPENCDMQQLKAAFFKLAKLYHPDGGTPTANADKFAQVERAYRLIADKLQRDGLEGKGDMFEEKDHDIKHTAPQHRRYLDLDGIGSGTPSQRQRQYQSYQIARAFDNVHEHLKQKVSSETSDAAVVKIEKSAKKHTIRNAIERLVEDLIQESMAKGDFDNLPGKGKPLQYTTYNPFLDTTDQKLNEVLINNGFTPDWIVLEKEIRKDTSMLRIRLREKRAHFGTLPLSPAEQDNWMHTLTTFGSQVNALNRKIDDYNLKVPILRKQLVQFSLQKEAEKILAENDGKGSQKCCPEISRKVYPYIFKSGHTGGFMEMLTRIFT